jgi:Ca-activated chloride channel family protein
MGLLALALAQPRWGRVPEKELPPGHDVILAVDTSWSMAAEDAVPNRLGVAVEAAESLVSALGKSEESRAGVVAFAGRGVVRCPLTENLGAVVDALKSLQPGDVQPGGTDLAAALEAALEAFGEETRAEGRSVIVFSDGEDHVRAWSHLLPKLTAAGVVVHAVAIGDPDRGHPIPMAPEGEPLKYRGEPVATERVDTALDAIAQGTGGALIRLGLSAADLGDLYRSRIAPVARLRREAMRPTQRAERYGVFVFAALVVALAGSWPRRRRLWRSRIWHAFGLALCAISLSGAADSGSTITAPRELIAKGMEAYRAQDFRTALAAFEQAIARAPHAAVPRYNAAAALFQLKQYEASLARYEESRSRAGAALRIKIDYALGNAALALGEFNAAIVHYDECVASRAQGAELDEVRRDAAINRQFAVEQARRAPQPPDEPKGQKPPGAQSKTRGSDNPDGGEPPTEKKAEAPESPGAPAGGGGPGGAGGTGSHAPRPGSPEARLAETLQNIREAKRRRLEDTPPTPPPTENRKNW